MAGFIHQQFEKELKKDNSHFERFKKSSLHDLVEVLKRKMPPASPAEVQKEMAKVPSAKWTKYTNVKRYLTQAFNLQVHAATAATTASVPGYTPGKWQREKDRDGRWHDYVLQERGNSCGPACVAMIKRAHYNLTSSQLSEQEIRGLIALAETGKLNEGISSLGDIARNAHDWINVGSVNRGLIQVLQANPHRVKTARDAGGMSADAFLDELRKCTPKKPAIVGWNWAGGRSLDLLHWADRRRGRSRHP